MCFQNCVLIIGLIRRGRWLKLIVIGKRSRNIDKLINMLLPFLANSSDIYVVWGGGAHKTNTITLLPWQHSGLWPAFIDEKSETEKIKVTELGGDVSQIFSLPPFVLQKFCMTSCWSSLKCDQQPLPLNINGISLCNTKN